MSENPLGRVATARFYVPEIDGLRFCAALLVFFHHAPALPFLKGVQNIGWIGVDLFLCISAYLLTCLLMIEARRSGTIDIKKFFIRRILRIWPLYFGYATAMSIIAILYFGVSAAISGGWLLSHLSFSANLLTAATGVSPIPFTTHLWTISLEEQAYFLLPLLSLVMAHKMPRLRYILGVLLTTSAVLALGRIAFYLAGMGPDFILRLLFRADPLIIGCAIALFQEQIRQVRGWWLALGLFATGTFIIIAPEWGIVAFYQSVAAMCACILLLAQRLDALKAILSLRPLTYLGKISYGIYVFHLLALGIAGKLFPTDPLAAIITGLVMGIVASMLSYHLYEARFLLLKRHFTVVESRSV